MGRVWKHWTTEKVEDALVAPHRYRWDGTVGPNGAPVGDIWAARTLDEARACFAYTEGEVVYLETHGKAVRAKIILRLTTYRNAFGDRAEAYHVVRETAKGLWVKNWERVHPGFIQRGYQLAGLAPDVDRHQPVKVSA